MNQPPEAVVVLHVGGAAGGTAASMDRCFTGFERLSERARARVAVENDGLKHRRRPGGACDPVGLRAV